MADAYNPLLHTVAYVVGDEDNCQIVPESFKKIGIGIGRSICSERPGGRSTKTILAQGKIT